jgi:ABC-type multidrug transport system fused ATPase/permease subunit
MGFILDGLESEDYDRHYSDRELLARIVAYFRPDAPKMILITVTMALHSIFGTATPILISRAVDLVAERSSPAIISFLCMGLLAVGLLAWVSNYIRQLMTAKVTGNVVLKLRQEAFNAAIHHDLSFYDSHPSGKIVTRITSDTQDFSDIITLVTDVIGQLLIVLILTVWLFHIHLPMTLLLLGMTPLAVMIALLFRRIARRVTRRARRVTAKINSQILESISGIMVAKTFRQERAVYRDFTESNTQAYTIGLRRGLVFSSIFPVMNLAAGLGIATLVYAGGWVNLGGGLRPGDWYLFMQAVVYFWWPLMSIASFWSQFQDGLSAAERVFALIDAETKVIQVADDIPARIEGRICFQDLTFGYDPAQPILDGFNLEIHPGETVALVGHTGAGKSSIARLVARFYEFQRGNLLIDGIDIRRFSLKDYRRHVGLVPQDPFLFSGTVADNIRYGNPDADDSLIQQTARGLGQGDWLEDLPRGLESDVGLRGGRLSMGQRQLVALSRVLLNNPAIFILDEATASVDPFTETRIQEGLDTVMGGRTAVVIAHRLSTVINADRILVMQKGSIIEEGTHQHLLTTGGYYADLYNTYFRHQSLDYIEKCN